jgi:3,4-dihydroxy 2-butanone 4-phosphate synthase/GTP cyclohydrolase II
MSSTLARDSGPGATRGLVAAAPTEALEDLRAGRVVVVVDGDEATHGHLVVAAEFATAETVNFMAREGRGLICLALTPKRCDELEVDLIPVRNESVHAKSFTVSIEARDGVTTGISAADRARTVAVAIDERCGPGDIVQPGHVLPLRAREGGVLARAAVTEAAVDLTRLAGLNPAAVICEVMDEDGEYAAGPALVDYCERHDLRLTTIVDLIAYRRRHERLVERSASGVLSTEFGEFRLIEFHAPIEGISHRALVMGDVDRKGESLVRVHSECLAGDVFHSLACSCGTELRQALRMIAREGAGVLVYLTGDGREAAAERGSPWHSDETAKLRGYGVGAQILADLGISRLRLLTNTPKTIPSLEGFGLEIVSQEPIVGTLDEDL